MPAYTIISGTNRSDSYTEKIALEYHLLLKAKSIDAPIFSLRDFTSLDKDAAFSKVEEEVLIPTRKFIFILPEYNGSYPGVVKAMIDMSNVKQCFWGKQALLVGISTGRAGNLRGMEHFTGVLNHIKVLVHPNKLPISAIDTITDDKGTFTHAPTLAAIDRQLNEFINFQSLYFPS